MYRANTLDIIREWKLGRFTVIVDAIEDDSSLDDLHSEPDAQDEIRDKLNSGEWTLFTARARVLLDGTEIASDYLGGCIYASPAEFANHMECGRFNRERAAMGNESRCGSYFAQMVHDVCEQARGYLADMQSIRVRHAG